MGIEITVFNCLLSVFKVFNIELYKIDTSLDTAISILHKITALILIWLTCCITGDL